MEDFFQILIWLFIIISFFSGFFKKKEKPAPPRQAPKRPESSMDTQAGTLESEQTSQDIFKEIENLFKRELPEERTSEPARVEQVEKQEGLQKRQYESTSIEKASEHLEKDQWHEPTYSEHTFENPWEKAQQRIESRKKKIDSSTEKQAKRFEQILSEKRTEENISLSHVKQKLSNHESVRDYIIFSEIIGKPKALRR